MKNIAWLITISILVLNSCSTAASKNDVQATSVHTDTPFLQDYSIKYKLNAEVELKSTFADRNGTIQIFSNEGLFRPHAGHFLYPGELVRDRSYLPMADKNLSGIGSHESQFIYLDDKALFGNAWAGSLYTQHQLNAPNLMAGAPDFHFLISDGKSLAYLNDSESIWKGDLGGEKIVDLKYHQTSEEFLILTASGLYSFSTEDYSLDKKFSGKDFTCFETINQGEKILVGTTNGYLELNGNSFTAIGDIHQKLPWPNLTVIREIDGNTWFGSERGAFMLKPDGKFNYYYGERWILGEKVVDIAAGDDHSVLLLTDGGLAKIVFEKMTLHDKAMYFEKQVRDRHIRYGFNSSLTDMEHGNFDTGRLDDSDNDGLWTSMYLGGQVFRYAVEPSEEALENIRESLAAMERLYTINPVPGFPSRSFARSGYIDRLSDPERWQHAGDPEWDWKATTSSDEAIGHAFVFGVIAELIDDTEIRDQAIHLLDILLQHIVDNDFYLVDYDGQPTTWGRWNPEYVNGFSKMVGDRKLNSSNILSMLQTAYHFTDKEIYKEKAFELMDQHGYLENLMVPMENIGRVEEGDDWSMMLSETWNHSDDEMYFLGYWGLYRYAFNDTLKAKYRESILDHWEAERPEKEGLWNIFTAVVSPDNFDLEEAIWYLQEYPLDLINWTMTNSHRKDIELLEPNFRRQTTTEVLPPDELRISRHNANRFTLDGGRGGGTESSAGDIWLLPYWMGRYLEVITEP